MSGKILAQKYKIEMENVTVWSKTYRTIYTLCKNSYRPSNHVSKQF